MNFCLLQSQFENKLNTSIEFGLSRVSRETKSFEIAQKFALSSREEIASLPYMHEGRVDVITAGALVLSRVMIATGATEFIASESDILDGMAWSLSQSAN